MFLSRKEALNLLQYNRMATETLSPLDGRYREQLTALLQVCGPSAFAAARVRAEAAWLSVLADLKLSGFKPLSAREKSLLDKLPVLTDEEVSEVVRIVNEYR